MSEAPAVGLVLAHTSQRERIDAVRVEMEGLRDAIADCELDIEETTRTISDFERVVSRQLRRERLDLHGVSSLIYAVDRWTRLLDETAFEDAMKRAHRLDDRRAQELDALQEEVEADDAKVDDVGSEDEDTALPSPAVRRRDALKAAYRSLARRFHPDLARDDRERVEFSRLMTQINEHYRGGDLKALEGLANQREVIVTDDTGSPAETLARLEKQRAWFTAVLENLEDERKRWHRHPTCRLLDEYKRSAHPRGFFHGLEKRLRSRVRDQLRSLRHAILAMEESVNRYNARAQALDRRRAEKSVEVFDPEGHDSFSRLLVEELGTRRDDPVVRSHANTLLKWAADDPSALDLLLLNHISERSPLPLAGLEDFQQIARRMAAVAASGAEDDLLERTLARLAHVVEYGVRRLTPEGAATGLRFRDEAWRAAVPLAWLESPVRQRLRRLCGVLGEERPCPSCTETVFSIPLIRSGGLDGLRALVCPSCGHALKRYWMERGDDIQSVLNSIYVDLELVSQWTVRIARGQAILQLVPVEVAAMRVGDLKRRLFADLFERYDLPLRRGHIRLHQHGRRIREKVSLESLAEHRFEVRLDAKASIDPEEALELLRYRIRRRYCPDSENAPEPLG